MTLRRIATIAAVTAAAILVSAAPATAGGDPETLTATTVFTSDQFRDITTDPVTGRVLVAADDGLHVFDREGNPETTIPGLHGIGGMAVDGRDLWFTLTNIGAIGLVDLDTLAVTGVLAVGEVVKGNIAVIGDFVWFPIDGNYGWRHLMRLDRSNGELENRGGNVHNGRIVPIPGSDTHAIFHDGGSNPFSAYRIDLRTNPITIEGDVPHGAGSSLQEMAVTERGTFVTASGSPYLFPEFNIDTMRQTGLTYGGDAYPNGVDYSPAHGGLIAGTTGSSPPPQRLPGRHPRGDRGVHDSQGTGVPQRRARAGRCIRLRADPGSPRARSASSCNLSASRRSRPPRSRPSTERWSRARRSTTDLRITNNADIDLTGVTVDGRGARCVGVPWVIPAGDSGHASCERDTDEGDIGQLVQTMSVNSHQAGPVETNESLTEVLACDRAAFPDVGPWARAAASWASCHEYMTGYPDGTFRPEQLMTRAEAANLTYNAAGRPDVSGTAPHGWWDGPAWIADALTWLDREGFMSGYPDGSFRPRGRMTRGQYVNALFRVAGRPLAEGSHPYADVPVWLDRAVTWASQDPDGDGPAQPLVTGYADGTFQPDRSISRAEAARLTCRASGAGEVC